MPRRPCRPSQHHATRRPSPKRVQAPRPREAGGEARTGRSPPRSDRQRERRRCAKQVAPGRTRPCLPWRAPDRRACPRHCRRMPDRPRPQLSAGRDAGKVCIEKLRKACGPAPSPASTTRSKPGFSSADRASALSTPHKATPGSSAARLVQEPKRRSSRNVSKPLSSSHLATTLVLRRPTSGRNDNSDVLSFDGASRSKS